MATANKVSATTFTTPSDREVVMTSVVDGPRRHVFDAWTRSEHLPHWMLGPSGWTMPVCEIDLRPGGAWHFVWRRSSSTEMGMRGVYPEITPPERLVSTESWGGVWPETLNTLLLSEKDGKTTIALTVLYASKEARERFVDRQFLAHLEKAAKRFESWTESRSPGHIAAMRQFMKQMSAHAASGAKA